MTTKLIEDLLSWADTSRASKMAALADVLDEAAQTLLSQGKVLVELTGDLTWISVNDEKPEEEQDVMVLMPAYGDPEQGWCQPRILRYVASEWIDVDDGFKPWTGSPVMFWRSLGKVTP